MIYRFNYRAGLVFILLFCGLCSAGGFAQSRLIDVKSYSLFLEPEIVNKSVSGKVVISFVSTEANQKSVTLDRGNLLIDSAVLSGKPVKFLTSGNKVEFIFNQPLKKNKLYKLEVSYHGEPKYGIRFFPLENQVYTEFSTNCWMVCNDIPSDKAKIEMTLILPDSMVAVANGKLINTHVHGNNKTEHRWKQALDIPTYTFGFAAGRFNVASDFYGKVKLNYFTNGLSDEEIKRVFYYTTEMFKFFEKCAGVKYHNSFYTQVFAAGNVMQEMTDFTVIKQDYAKEILANERDIWLTAHELSHQWWGNMVTCIDWRHFWLNEGMATFMVAAFKEFIWGKEEYTKEIEKIKQRYEKVAAAGKDKPLVFPDWDKPTSEDRTIVYSKGAYVIYLLRNELGDDLFWKGIKEYTRKFYGKSVTTKDFQRAMEKAAGRSLKVFFDKWVYGGV